MHKHHQGSKDVKEALVVKVKVLLATWKRTGR